MVEEAHRSISGIQEILGIAYLGIKNDGSQCWILYDELNEYTAPELLPLPVCLNGRISLPWKTIGPANGRMGATGGGGGPMKGGGTVMGGGGGGASRMYGPMPIGGGPR